MNRFLDYDKCRADIEKSFANQKEFDKKPTATLQSELLPLDKYKEFALNGFIADPQLASLRSQIDRL